MPDLIPFAYNGKDVPVRLDTHGDALWRAADIGKALGYKGDMGQHARRLDNDERTLIPNQGGQVEWWVNESGLYNLILGSRKPEAKAFRRWITHEVIPTIRKTGKYEVTQVLDHYPELKAITELALSTAQARDEAARALAQADAAEQRAIRAEAKADIALQEVHRMTLEEFVLGNKLLPQFPMPEWGRIATWLSNYCGMYNLEAIPVPVHGKPWPTEKSYPLPAFAAWLRYEARKPHQLQIVGDTP